MGCVDRRCQTTEGTRRHVKGIRYSGCHGVTGKPTTDTNFKGINEYKTELDRNRTEEKT